MRDLLRNTLLAGSMMLPLTDCAHRNVGSGGPSDEPPTQNAPWPVQDPDSNFHDVEPEEPYKPVLCFPGAPAKKPEVTPPKTSGFYYVEELPEVTEKVQPVYPLSARGRDGDREVRVQALVRRDGTVGEVCIVKSIPALDTAAAMCVKQWRFKPAKTAGNTVAVWVGLRVRFEVQ